MNGNTHQRLYNSHAIRRLVGLFNRLPLPYRRLWVRVHGHRMAGHTLDRIGALWFWKLGLLEYEVIQLLPQICTPGMRALDIGANLGLYTLQFAKYAGRDGHVWAFEPEQRNYEALQRNIAANGYGNITVDSRAVGQRTEIGTLFMSESHQGDHRTFSDGSARPTQPIEVVAIDDMFLGEAGVDLVKVDVQGAEFAVLSGMAQLMRRSKTVTLIIEISEDRFAVPGASALDTARLLETMGFKLAYIDTKNGRLTPVATATQLNDALRNREYLNVIATKNPTLQKLAESD